LTSRRRADLDELAYELRRQGLSFRAIAARLGVTERMARRRVVRHERVLREQVKAASRPQSNRQ
jgi:DNA-binding Lrp family transcriptional regulator